MFRGNSGIPDPDVAVCFLEDGALTVQKSGGRYVVKKNEKFRAFELGRYAVFMSYFNSILNCNIVEIFY